MDVKPNRMYLHAHRLVLPNSVEPLDLNAGDPFVTSGSDPSSTNSGPDSSSSDFYEETEIVHSLDSSVYEVFEDKTLPWRTLP